MSCSGLSSSISAAVFLTLVLCFANVRSMEYVGCYYDSKPDRLLTGDWTDTTGRMTIDLCQDFCTSNSTHTYFGVQYGKECFCGENPKRRPELTASECMTSKCEGDESQWCGGTNKIRVYTVCTVGNYSTDCRSRCHCAKSDICTRQDGLCPAGCEAGYNGSSCSQDINECLTNNGGCAQNCTNTEGSFECFCRVGYNLTENQLGCKDINECLTNNGGCAHNCINTEGSFECFCRVGYNLTENRLGCEDIDECLINKGGCQYNCTNLPGSFECNCPSHLNLDSSGFNCTAEPKKPPGPSSWKRAVIGACCGVAALVIIIIGILMCRRFRRSKGLDGKLPRSSRPISLVSSAINKLKNGGGRSVDDVLRRSGDVTPPTGSDVALVVNDGVIPVYENITGSPDPQTTRIHVTDLHKVVQQIRSSPQILEREFKKVPEKSEESYKFAEHPDLKSKNKYKNILPYDSNRVILSQIDEDDLSTYINASFIDGYNWPKKYIASHGPKLSTIGDFWRMIWEYNITVVVMLTNCKENGKAKCDQYWPSTVDKAMTYGDEFSVQLISEKESREYVTRCLQVSKDGESRELTHIQYTAWPDHGVPTHSIPLLTVRHTVNSLTATNSAKHTNPPILVHCSAGVGRTGTYIGLDNLLDEAADKKEVDVNSAVLALRHQRMNSVQTLEQYSFIYKALYEGLVFGVTRIPVTDLERRVKGLSAVHPVSGHSTAETEFNLIREMQPVYSEESCSDALSPANKAKNRDLKYVPTNLQRLIYVNESDAARRYINAVIVPSAENSQNYISTQLPLKNTIEDFWRMCLDYKSKTIVVLVKDNQNLAEDLKLLIPPAGEWLHCGKISVGNVPDHTQQQQQLRSGSHLHRLTVRDEESGTSQQQPDPIAIYENTVKKHSEVDVMLILATLPTNEEKLSDAIINLNIDVMSLTGENEQQAASVVIVSRDGVELSGQYMVTSNCLSLIRSDDVVDVVQSVLDLKRARPHFISKYGDYMLLYRTISQYCNQASLYANCRN